MMKADMKTKGLRKDLEALKQALAAGAKKAVEARVKQLTHKFRKLYQLRMKS